MITYNIKYLIMKENDSDYDNYNGSSVASSFQITNKDKFNIYSECLTTLFEKMKKVLSKSNPYYDKLFSFLKDYKSQLEQDRVDFCNLNADKYYQYIKMSLEGDKNKIAEVFLEQLQILIREKLLTGGSDDVDINFQTATAKTNNQSEKFKMKPKVINSIIATISKFVGLNDKIICLNSINLLQLIALTSKNGIHDISLGQILTFYFWVYSSSTTSILVDSSKKSLTEIIKNHFRMMEETTHNLIKENQSFNDEFLSTSDNSKDLISLSLNENDTSLFNNEFTPIYKTPIDKMISKRVKCIVDSICLYTERSKQNKKCSLSQIPKDAKEIVTNSSYSDVTKFEIVNEKGNKCGYFGWCYICREAADYYDKETRLPICSMKCKKKIREENHKIAKYINGELINEDDIALFFFNDCKNIFINLCKMVSSSPSKNETFNTKAKMLALEILSEVISLNGKFISTKKDFAVIIKENLIENLLTNSLSDDQNIFKLSITLFFKLWQHFREHLKQEISVFNETVFLKILDSENSSYEHKLCILENFQSQAETPQYYIELYANYDCDRNENFLVNRIVTALGKIGQGKYLKGDHSLTSIQENNLKTKALKTLTLLVNSLLNFTFDQLNNEIITDDRYDDIYSIEEISAYSENVTIDAAKKEKTIDENLQYKNTLEKAVEKFNIKAKNGINFLKKVGFIHKNDKEQEAKDIASFLKQNQNLNKTYIGDILGDDSEINLKVLYYYTESFQFTSMPFLQALRYYLSTFQIPGEGQKIERIVEVFSNKYTSDNPNYFPESECAYYLAFSVLLLQTELHNPNVKEKMTVEGFKGLLFSRESMKKLSDDYIAEVYDEISKNPLSLPEIERQKELMQTNKDAQLKFESIRLLNEVKEKLKHGKGKQYLVICEFEYVSPLMSSIWSALLAVFSVILEETDDENLYNLCLEGMTKTICLLSLLGLDFEKGAFIKGLCKVTNLFQSKEMKMKNVACIKKIIELGLKEGEPYYKSSWSSVFEVISKLDFFFTLNFLPKSEKENYYSEYKIKRKTSNNIDKEISIEKSNIELISKELKTEDYDKIFNRSENFNDSAIIDFISSLCEIANDEIRKEQRMFSFLKLIEVAELNMERSTEIWRAIWKKCSQVLIAISVSESEVVHEKGIDCLRLLSIKYLEKKHDATFQSELLESFKLLIVKFDEDKEKYKKNKEFSVSCIVNLVQCEGRVLKENGWLKIFEIIQLLSTDSNEEIHKGIFVLLKQIIQDYAKETKNIFPEITTTLIHFIVAFPEKVIELLTKIILQIDTKEKFLFALKNYSELVKDKRENINKIALKEIFDLINQKILHKTFAIDESFFNDLINEIFHPLCNFLISSLQGKVLSSLLEQIIQLMNANQIFLSNAFIALLQLIKSMCIAQEEVIATTGINCFKLLLDEHKYSQIKNYPSLLLSCIADIFEATLQKEFFSLDSKEISLPSNKNKYQPIISRNIIYTIVQHNLLIYTKNFINWFKQILSDNDIKRLLTCLKRSYQIAINFNLNFDLRDAISKNYIEDCKTCLGIFNQQDKGLNEYFDLLMFCIYNKTNTNVSEYKDELLTTSINLMKIFVEQLEFCNADSEIDDEEEIDELTRERERLFDRLCFSMENDILPSLQKIEYYKEEKYKDEIHQLLVKCIICNSREIRSKLQDVLLPALLYQNKK